MFGCGTLTFTGPPFQASWAARRWEMERRGADAAPNQSEVSHSEVARKPAEV